VTPHATTNRAIRWAPFVAALLASGLLSCEAVDRAPAARSAPDEPTPRIASLIREWFFLLEGLRPEPDALDGFVVESPLVLSLTEGEDPGPDGLRAWVSDLRSPFPQVEFRLDALHTHALGDDLYRAHFELDRRAVDGEGAPHVARAELTWLIRDPPSGPPEVLRIEERRLLSFPGTGPQVVCF
jgi:hypothetical protein